VGNFTPGVAYAKNLAAQHAEQQIKVAVNAIHAALTDYRGYVSDSWLADQASDLLAELMDLDGSVLGVIAAAVDPVAEAHTQLDRLPPNALFPADSLRDVPRYVGREACADKQSSDAHVGYVGPGELRREARQQADQLGINLWDIAEKAREIGARERAAAIEKARVDEAERVARVKLKSALDENPDHPLRRRRHTVFG
jgi:hypothetical protein